MIVQYELTVIGLSINRQSIIQIKVQEIIKHDR